MEMAAAETSTAAKVRVALDYNIIHRADGESVYEDIHA